MNSIIYFPSATTSRHQEFITQLFFSEFSGTGAQLTSFNLSQFMQQVNASSNPATMLAHLESIVRPGDASDEEFTVYRVASASLLTNSSGIRVRTLDGQVFNVYNSSGAPSAGINSNTSGSNLTAAGRRLADSCLYYTQRVDDLNNILTRLFNDYAAAQTQEQKDAVGRQITSLMRDIQNAVTARNNACSDGTNNDPDDTYTGPDDTLVASF